MNMYPRLDVNGDGLITRADFILGGAAFGPIGMAVGNQLFNRFDWNGDGVLNPYEAYNASLAMGGMGGPYGYGFSRYGYFYY